MSGDPGREVLGGPPYQVVFGLFDDVLKTSPSRMVGESAIARLHHSGTEVEVGESPRSSLPTRERARKTRAGRAGRKKVVLPFLLPALTLYSLVFVYPAVQALWISLHEWNGFQAKMTYVGFGNFTRMLSDETFWSALQNTLLITVIG